MEQVFEPPVDVSWFQKELDLACRDRGCTLRIAWAPPLTVARVIRPDGITRDYAKYPILFGDFRSYVRGRYYVRPVGGKMVTIGYQKTGALVPPGVLHTDLAVTDIAHVNASIHQFVIERKLPDESAKRTHEEKQRLARMKLGFNLFPPFPKEGIWDWFDYINEHRDGCCEAAESAGIPRCVGLYREPDHGDLERVRAALKEWVEKPRYENPLMAAELAGQVRTKELIAAEDNALLEILKDVRECSALDKIAQERTRVSVGVNPPIHRTPY